jgi:hypothetical protein
MEASVREPRTSVFQRSFAGESGCMQRYAHCLAHHLSRLLRSGNLRRFSFRSHY